MKLSSLAGPAQTKKRLQTLACIACRLSEVCDRKEKDMEHRHIPASKDGSIPSAKTRFWRGEDNFLEDVWYGRCAICGELIRPPKPWYFIRNVLGYFLTVPYAVIPALIDVPESTALSKALLFTSGFAVLLIIWKLAINACLAFGQWQLLPDGLEGEKLRKRTNRKSEKMWWIYMAVGCFAFAIFLIVRY